MPVDGVVFAFAGIMVVASIVLAYFVSPWWLLLTAFVGVNMLQAAAIAFKRLGLPIGEAFK
jgi:hypothetical protein